MDYPFDLVKEATRSHMKNAKFAPTPADIIELLESKNKRPTADEAWSIVPKDDAYGYEKTVIWTQEMAQGWASVCQDYQTDRVGARMAFKESYVKLCQQARDIQKPVTWQVSLGYDKNGHEGALIEAVRLGRLPVAHAKQFLPHIEDILENKPMLEPMAAIKQLAERMKAA